MEIIDFSNYFTDEWKYNISIFVMNGLHLPIIAFMTYLLGLDPLLIYFIFMKLYTYNYFNCFQIFEKNNKYYYLTHMIRLTDTGHIASLIFYFNRDFLPIAHNVHFVITFAYWFCRILFKLNQNYIENGLKYKLLNVDQIYTILNHSTHYVIMCYYLYIDENSCTMFNEETRNYSFAWLYTWLLCIYIPWVYVTNDYVYSVLEPSNHWAFQLFIVLFVNLIMQTANNIVPTICLLK